jgi:hypothetical protein
MSHPDVNIALFDLAPIFILTSIGLLAIKYWKHGRKYAHGHERDLSGTQLSSQLKLSVVHREYKN